MNKQQLYNIIEEKAPLLTALSEYEASNVEVIVGLLVMTALCRKSVGGASLNEPFGTVRKEFKLGYAVLGIVVHILVKPHKLTQCRSKSRASVTTGLEFTAQQHNVLGEYPLQVVEQTYVEGCGSSAVGEADAAATR